MTNIHFALKLFAASALLALAGSASAQSTKTATAPANASVVCGIAITNQSNLYFGTVYSGAGTAHVTAAGSESYTGGIGAGTHSGTHAPAQFLVTGQSGFTFAITTTPGTGILTVTDGSGHSASVHLDAPIAASGTTLGSLSVCTGTTSGRCNSDNNGPDGDHDTDDQTNSGGCCGTLTFNVGGVLTTTSSQYPGTYSNANSGGTAWSETVTYN